MCNLAGPQKRCERDEIGRAMIEHIRHVPNFEASPGGNEQGKVPNRATFAHDSRQRHHPVRGDRCLVDKPIGAPQAMMVLEAAG